MKRRPNFYDAYRFFAPLIGVPCVIAGGSVRDGVLDREPRDFDLFTFQPFCADAITVAAELVSDQRTGYGRFTLSRVLTVNWRGYEVQIIHRNDHNVFSMLKTFDWNVCQFAYGDADGLIAEMDPDAIGPGGMLRLNCLEPTLAARTLARGHRFAERYSMQIDDSDLARLCRHVARNHEQTHEPAVA